MDVIFDIDGTLANAEHRLHFIKDPDKAKDWESFLSDEQVAGDKPIPQTWDILTSFVNKGDQIIFITGRPERQRDMTWNWLTDYDCDVRGEVAEMWHNLVGTSIDVKMPWLFMRQDGDRRPSHVVKGELLDRVRAEGFEPTMVFEDRKDDTKMWREKGLLCLQVAEGDY